MSEGFKSPIPVFHYGGKPPVVVNGGFNWPFPFLYVGSVEPEAGEENPKGIYPFVANVGTMMFKR